ncbi:hypothetical protein HA402_002211 [Bradysia odoriphaga]|nr:hypothetical protein HA402_002211 [Bradysia odoriphaga]
MNFVRSLLIFTTTILVNNFNVAFEDRSASKETVHIDVLIQRYMAVEKSLWNEIRGGQTRPHELILNIRNVHDATFSRETLAFVMSDEIKLRFAKYLNLSVFESYLRDDQTNRNISNVILSDYNSTLTNDLFEEIRKDTESQSCDNRSTQLIESSNHNIFLFYQLFIALMLISYATEQSRNMMQAVKHGVADYDNKILTNKFKAHYTSIGYLAMNKIKDASKDVWMCDLDFYIKDDESIQITNLLQGYVENEVNLNKESSCSGSCEDYKYARNRHCAPGTFCGDQSVNGSKSHICTGVVVDCMFIESDMTICPSLDSNKRRRYDSIKYSSGRHMGREFCGRERHEVESYLSIWMSYCSYCFCYCDADTENSDRYFSLRPAVSDISQNKIITGVGIVKRNGIFSWSITQSTLLSNGRVNQLPKNITRSYSPSDSSADEVYQDFILTPNGEDSDYRKLSWQNRSINLATVQVPQGSVITGIRFTVLKDHLNFEIRATRFDFNKGFLYDQNEWISNKNEKRSVLLLDRPEPSHPIPINSELCKRSIPDFTQNKFIKFRPSDPDKDAGQTTVPFIDTQMVRPKELTLLSGISIYYKGRPGFGGFIAPKLIVYDMSKHLTN